MAELWELVADITAADCAVAALDALLRAGWFLDDETLLDGVGELLCFALLPVVAVQALAELQTRSGPGSFTLRNPSAETVIRLILLG